MFEDMPPPVQPAIPQRNKFIKIGLPLLAVLALIAAAFMGSLYIMASKPELLGLSKPVSTEQIEKENKKIAEKVAELIILPVGEVPIIRTISEDDLVQSRSQQFFSNAMAGDKILLYTNAKKLYIYRPGSHKIVEVGIINPENPSATQVSGATDSIPEVITPTPFPTPEPLGEEEVDSTPEPLP
jgi:hypothetical protein